jgi:hypothetical protein
MPVGGLKKRRRDRNLAAWLRQTPKGRTRGSLVSWKRLTVAGRRMTRCARVTWRKRNLAREYCTRANVVKEAWRARVLGRRLRSLKEGGEGIRDLGGRRPLYRIIKRPTKDIGGCNAVHRSLRGSKRISKEDPL